MSHNKSNTVQTVNPLPVSLLSVKYLDSWKSTDNRVKATALVPAVTGTDEALALVSLGTGLWVVHLAGVLTEPSLHHCQRYCDRPVINKGK